MQIKLKIIMSILGLAITISACSNLNNTQSKDDAATVENTTALVSSNETVNQQTSLHPIEENATTSGTSQYSKSLSDDDMSNAKAVAERFYKKSPYNGIVSISAIDDDSSHYAEDFIKDKYSVGNIIIFDVLTQKDIDDGNPKRQIYIGRTTEDSFWEVITEGF